MVVIGDQFVLCKAALIFAMTRWLLSFALNFLTTSADLLAASSDSCCSSSPPPLSSSKLRIVRDSLSLTTLGHLQPGIPEASCAVCLNRLRKNSPVWKLSNCCHVFHKHCLERWLSYDARLSCPLCRASLVTASPLPPASLPEPPSWAVEQMLYLFGDDLVS